MNKRIRLVASVLLLTCSAPMLAAGWESASGDDSWRDSFDVEKLTHLTSGRNRFFILQPGYQIILANKSTQVAITVLDETEKVNGILTRVVEEKEFENGELKEVSRNFFTICKEHGDVFYHGEDVDDYQDGKIVGHHGAWRAGGAGARAGLMMPAKTPAGLKHYQEVAPGVAMDRAEIVDNDLTLETPTKKYPHCLKVVETTPLEPGEESTKIHAPEVGMVFDDGMVIIEHGPGRKSPQTPIAVQGDLSGALAEVEIAQDKVPKPVSALVRKLYPKGRVHEVKRETRADGSTVFAIEIFIGEQQYDVEATADGKLLRNQKEERG